MDKFLAILMEEYASRKFSLEDWDVEDEADAQFLLRNVIEKDLLETLIERVNGRVPNLNTIELPSKIQESVEFERNLGYHTNYQDLSLREIYNLIKDLGSAISIQQNHILSLRTKQAEFI